MNARRDLTVRGVKAILTRAGVDHLALEVFHDPALWTDLETGRQGTSVVIKGPKEARRRASHALYARPEQRPYPDLDMWSRP